MSKLVTLQRILESKVPRVGHAKLGAALEGLAVGTEVQFTYWKDSLYLAPLRGGEYIKVSRPIPNLESVLNSIVDIENNDSLDALDKELAKKK